MVCKQFSVSASKLEGVDPYHELQIMKTIQHEYPTPPPNLIPMLSSVEVDDSICIVLEYTQCDSLSFALTCVPLTEEQVSSITYQVLNALELIHNAKIAHRDIKPSNFLFTMMGEVKLADFGVAIVQETTQPSLVDFIGTIHYIPPEIALRTPYNHSCDIWSLGISVIEMLLGSVPLETTPGLDILPLLKDPSYNPLHQIPFDSYQSLSATAVDFITQCCTVDPTLRPDAAKLKTHPFVSKGKGKKSPLYPLCDQLAPLVKANHFPQQ